MASAEKYVPHYTVKDYRNWSGDWELWRGIPVSMSPAARPRHQQVAANLARQLGNLLEKTLACHQCATLHETDWVVSDDTVVRPDVLVTCEPLPDTHLESAPVLIAEVLSPATADKDRTAKLSLYQAEGVRYYAMLDPESGESELHELSSAGYRLMKGPVYRLSFAAGCIIDVDLSACLPR